MLVPFVDCSFFDRFGEKIIDCPLGDVGVLISLRLLRLLLLLLLLLNTSMGGRTLFRSPELGECAVDELFGMNFRSACAMGMRDGFVGESSCGLGLTGDLSFGIYDGGDDCSNGIVSGECRTLLPFGLDGDSSDDFFSSSSQVSSLLVP